MDGWKKGGGREGRGLRDLMKVVAQGWVLVILVISIEIAGLTKQNHP